MFRTLCLILLLVPAALRGASPLQNAWRARALLGDGVWARVLRVENTRPANGYPATVFAVVFEVGGILWFYTDTDGTQSLSLHVNDLAAEKADLAPLLRAIDPGFVAYRVLTKPVRPGWWPGDLPNGCFIESHAALRERMAAGELILEARLLSYYVVRDGRSLGHTVLAFDTPRGAFVLDPQAMTRAYTRRRGGEEALAVARALQPGLTVESARWIPLSVQPPGSLLAALGRRAPAGRGGWRTRQ